MGKRGYLRRRSTFPTGAALSLFSFVFPRHMRPTGPPGKPGANRSVSASTDARKSKRVKSREVEPEGRRSIQVAGREAANPIDVSDSSRMVVSISCSQSFERGVCSEAASMPHGEDAAGSLAGLAGAPATANAI